MKTSSLIAVVSCAGLAIALGNFCSLLLRAQGDVPHYEVDPYWPKPFPDRWVTGEVAGVCIDSQDHVFIEHRVSDLGGGDNHREGLTDNELDAGHAAPPATK